MPPIEEVDCWDTAVLWAATDSYDSQGQPVIGSPVELDYPNGVRWLNKRTQMLDPKGNLINVDATVVVLQDIPIGSHMWQGSLDDWYGTGSGATDNQLMVVKAFDSTGALNDRFFRRTVGLMRYHH